MGFDLGKGVFLIDKVNYQSVNQVNGSSHFIGELSDHSSQIFRQISQYLWLSEGDNLGTTRIGDKFADERRVQLVIERGEHFFQQAQVGLRGISLWNLCHETLSGQLSSKDIHYLKSTMSRGNGGKDTCLFSSSSFSAVLDMAILLIESRIWLKF